MKNCEPLVPGPELAMASRYRPVELEVGVELVLEPVAGAAGPRAEGVAALDHEAGITRWKIVPSYNGDVVFCPVRGSAHSRLPSASSTKFRTVLGAWSGNSFTAMSP